MARGSSLALLRDDTIPQKESTERYNSVMRKKLTTNLKRLLQREGISQSQLAKLTRLPTSNLGRLINGEADNPTLETLRSLSRYFGVEVSQLIGDKPIPGLDKDITGTFEVPYPNNPDTLKLIRRLADADQKGQIGPEVSASLLSLLDAILSDG